ncbi:unnamed protein product [Adineta steineri]|uniref:G-protein coupled receptors family 1 profile domain-containing protein n=1 Tax=Adineta steineri TaxID=433720 RepID=A0A814IEL6_9BILA|nr:unnamed protein product [Adineta steineri]CAF1043644.1 unnamed protein product [Adineta steineri]
MSTFVIAAQLEIVTEQINRYVTLFLLLLGVIGNLCNCLVFTQRNLRSNPCCVYFLVASLANLILCITALTPRSITGWNPNADLTETVSAFCRLLMFLLLSARCIVAWIIAFASVDRYLTSSPNVQRRQMSKLKNSYYCISSICIISLLIWLEGFFCFDANQVGTPIKCYTTSDVCQMYNNLAIAFFIIIIPVIVMLVFGFSTIKNIHGNRRVTTNLNNEHTGSTNRRSESSLTKMLLIQVLILTLFSLPLAIITLYLSWTFYQQKALLQQIIEGFLFNIFLLMAFIPNCISFCLYTLSGSVFRQTFIDIGKRTMRRLLCYH